MTGVPGLLRERILPLMTLVIAGEMIFALPFHLPRYFRPSVLETFDLSNAQLGDIFAVYGVTAMLSYFPGGALADRFGARRLMALSLLLTALGGAYLVTIPGVLGLAVLYGYWGVTTILLFWAAMIRATRGWGGATAQGRAFGLLDGGRGLAAAAFAAVAVAIFSRAVADPGGNVRDDGLRQVVLFYSTVTMLVALLVWRCGPRAAGDEVRGRDWSGTSLRESLSRMTHILGQGRVWALAGIVVAAYCGYKGLDNYALYAYDVLGESEASAASFAAAGAWVRPVAALTAGLLADRVGPSRLIAVLFGLAAVNYALLALLDPAAGQAVLVSANLWLSFAAVFALRGVYFAVLAEVRVPFGATGTAVGLVSVVGYTPDVFFAPLAGRLLDASPGIAGHHHYFLMLSGIAVAGMLLAAGLSRRLGRQQRGERE